MTISSPGDQRSPLRKIRKLDTAGNTSGHSSDHSISDSVCTTSEDNDAFVSSGTSNSESVGGRAVVADLHTHRHYPKALGNTETASHVIWNPAIQSKLAFNFQMNGDRYIIENTVYCSNCSIAFMPSYTGEREFCSRGKSIEIICISHHFISCACCETLYHRPFFRVDCETSLALERHHDYYANRLLHSSSRGRGNVETDGDSSDDMTPEALNQGDAWQDNDGPRLRIQVSWGADSAVDGHCDNAAAAAPSLLPPTARRHTMPSPKITIPNPRDVIRNRKEDGQGSAFGTYVNYPLPASRSKQRYNYC